MAGLAPIRAETITLLAFGDSLTQGYGLEASEGLVPQLETWLREAGEDVRLINGGVSGDTTAGGANRIAWSLTEEIDGVIVALGGNDLLRGLPTQNVRANLDQILDEIDARALPALIVGYRATPNFGPTYKADFDAIYPELAQAHGALLFPYVFEGMAEAVAAGKATQDELMQDDGIHPNARGVALNITKMGPAVQKLLEKIKAPGT